MLTLWATRSKNGIINERPAGKVRAYFSWYGEYLLRLYAVSNGIPAYDFELQKVEKERTESRRTMVGSGDRSERIRTYNFPQGRVTDHRINLTLYKLEKILNGESLNELIDSLIENDQINRLSKLDSKWLKLRNYYK
mgnify:CR=1 FL=1